MNTVYFVYNLCELGYLATLNALLWLYDDKIRTEQMHHADFNHGSSYAIKCTRRFI